MVDEAYFPQDIPVTYYFFPGKKYGVIWIVHMRRFTASSIYLNNRKIPSLLQFVPIIEPDVQATKIKTFYPLANIIYCGRQLVVDKTTCINEFSAPHMISKGHEYSFFRSLQYSF